MLNRPMIIDVDTGVDDAVALALATSLGANILGVTTVAGNVPIDMATRNTLDVLAHLGRADIPVHRGASRPLTATYQDATHVHGGNGLGGVQLDRAKKSESTLPGPARIIEAAMQSAGDLIIVTLGPLTNVAIAINVRPEIVERVGRVVIMGGAYFVPGNVRSHAEFNVYVDPEAAHQVFNAPWREICLVGLDVTHQTVFSRQQWEAMPGENSGAAGLVQKVMARTFTDRAMSGFYLHDPLAIAVALRPELVAGGSFAVRVDSTPEARGKTVAQPGPGPMVATSVDASAFLKLLSHALELPDADHGIGFERAE